MAKLAHFLTHMASVYKLALAEMLDRLVYKQLLQQLNDQGVSLRDTPAVHMYQLADQGRLSTFFRLEEETDPILTTIESLANEHLGVSQQYYTDTKRAMARIKERLIANGTRSASVTMGQ